MADLYLSQNSKAKALEKLKAAWALDPQDPKVIRQIGEDFQRLGQAELAKDCFDRAKIISGVRELGH
jgi:Tfp pilus assembly protein PilF